MEKKSLEELVSLLRKMDPEAAATIDLKNRRRVLRALEVVTFSGKPFSQQRQKARPVVEPFLIGIAWTKEELHRRIDEAIERMIERGWIDEIRRLHKKGIAWDAPAMTSIGYRELARYVRGESGLEEAIEKVKRATKQYAKRQMTWFKRDKRIHWLKDAAEAEKLVAAWLGDS
jgi:tRNA dimethylallyltransferase